ncbi:hypothetical protein P8452_53968 [Trifolium repens]|nr:hypothetical protein P8452_53968 [Trifolium repens]
MQGNATHAKKLYDVEEMLINIGMNEGLSILQASLTSKSVLTNSLNQYIGSRAALADLPSNASLKDRPLKNTHKF